MNIIHKSIKRHINNHMNIILASIILKTHMHITHKTIKRHIKTYEHHTKYIKRHKKTYEKHTHIYRAP